MTQEGFKRKLTAILSADVIGYSRLMRDSEEATVRDLAAHRVVLTEIIQQHHGRVVDSPGDNILAEFASVVDAVNCAIKIQEEIRKSNTDNPEDRRMEFRIGINLGDVIEEEGRIYGDGVNIAARVEGIAAAGGIAISGTVYEHIKDKLSLGYHYLGEQNVKNIPEPVEIYQLLTEPADAGKMIDEKKPKTMKWRWVTSGAIALIILVVGAIIIWHYYFRAQIESASLEKMAFPLPDKPSIAVLPFENISGDPEQEYFSDGITEDLITDLSKISGLFVIARNSVFIYKGRTIKIAEVGRELGVRHVLEGSVRKANGRVRITAQLVDATTQGHLWAERYDRDLKDIFALQDEVTQKIVAALAVKLTEDEQERLVRKYTENMEAYDSFLQGMELIHHHTKEANVQARQMYKRAIDLDPKFAAAYALLGLTYSQEWSHGWSQNPQALERAFELAQAAIALDNSLPFGHAILGEIYLWKKHYEKAVAEQEKAIALSPSDADLISGLGGILNWAGRPEEAIELVKKAMRLNPMYQTEYLWNLGHAYFLRGRYGEAIETLKRARDRNPEYLPVHVYLSASYINQGQQKEARAEAAEASMLSPQTSMEAWKQRLPYKNQAVLERLIDSLRKAGFK
ncbi:MAG: adenylate/guanylate cyclase domain-containing protein [Desulfobacterales bacterium]|jgi:TolB-like protein/class 3 adenylate cyclase/Flp pilus assembly protein TadD|nr:adenylate/guanylate cyclase domain-containing protein [Desulfobacterales bacterium]